MATAVHDDGPVMRRQGRDQVATIIRIGKAAVQQNDWRTAAERGVPDIPLTGAYPLSAGVGSFGVGGKVSHCGSPNAAVADVANNRQKAKMKRRMAQVTLCCGQDRYTTKDAVFRIRLATTKECADLLNFLIAATYASR